MSRPRYRLRGLIEALVEAEVRFVLVGALAVIAWGHERFTRDVDLVPDPDPENLDRLAAVLAGLNGKVMAGEHHLSSDAISVFLRTGDMALVTTDLGQVDVLQGVPHVPRYEDLLRDSEIAELDGLEVRVCSGPHLLAMKRAAARPHDLQDIEALLAAHPEWSA